MPLRAFALLLASLLLLPATAAAQSTPVPAPSPVPTATPEPYVPVNWEEVSSVKTNRPVFALTFDAGGELGATIETLDVLASRGVKATFFIVGDWAEHFPAAVARMAADGHEIANHSATHPDFTTISNARIVQELERADATLAAITGVTTTRPLMRPPFGARDRRVNAAVVEAGYRSIYWSLDSADWREGATAPRITSRVLTYTDAGDIVVFHCYVPATAAALPEILDTLAERGIRPVTLTDLLRDEAP